MDRRTLIAAAALAPDAMAGPRMVTPAFDPAAWIKQFLAVGGLITLRADGVSFGYQPENEEAVSLVMSCHCTPGQWDAVRKHAGRFAA